MTVQLEYINQNNYILLALCLMLLISYYAQNYANIIGWSLRATNSNSCIPDYLHQIIELTRLSFHKVG